MNDDSQLTSNDSHPRNDARRPMNNDSRQTNDFPLPARESDWRESKARLLRQWFSVAFASAFPHSDESASTPGAAPVSIGFKGGHKSAVLLFRLDAESRSAVDKGGLSVGEIEYDYERIY